MCFFAFTKHLISNEMENIVEESEGSTIHLDESSEKIKFEDASEESLKSEMELTMELLSWLAASVSNFLSLLATDVFFSTTRPFLMTRSTWCGGIKKRDGAVCGAVSLT